MVEPQSSKLATRVRFPSPAPPLTRDNRPPATPAADSPGSQLLPRAINQSMLSDPPSAERPKLLLAEQRVRPITLGSPGRAIHTPGLPGCGREGVAASRPPP